MSPCTVAVPSGPRPGEPGPGVQGAAAAGAANMTAASAVVTAASPRAMPVGPLGRRRIPPPVLVDACDGAVLGQRPHTTYGRGHGSAIGHMDACATACAAAPRDLARRP